MLPFVKLKINKSITPIFLVFLFSNKKTIENNKITQIKSLNFLIRFIIKL